MFATTQPMSRSDRLLVLALRAFMNADVRAELVSAVGADRDWEGFFSRARGHGVAEVTCHVLRQHEDLLPPEVVELMLHEARLGVARSIRCEAAVARVLDALAATGARPIVLKGPSVSRSLYPSPDMRQYGDLDLLVKESDWRCVGSAMEKIGAVPDHGACSDLPQRIDSADCLDHWFRFTTPDGLAVECALDAHQLGIGMRDPEGLWERATSLPGTPVLQGEMLSAEDQVVLLAVHLNRHGFRRLVWHLDIALLIQSHPELDWSYVADAARAQGLVVCVRATLLRVAELFGMDWSRQLGHLRASPVGSAVWRRYWPTARLQQFEGLHEGPLLFRKSPSGQRFGTFVEWSLANLLIVGRRRDKFRFLVRKIAPPRSFIASRYGGDGGSDSYLSLWLRRFTAVLLGQRAARTDTSTSEGRARHNFINSLAWNSVAKVSTRAMQFFVTIVLARLLTPEEFGIMGMASMLTIFVVMFAEFGFAHALIQKQEMSDEDVETAQTFSIGFGTILTVVCVLGASFIAAVFNAPQLEAPVKVASVGILIASFGTTPRSVLYRAFDFRSIAIADFAGATVYGTLAIALAVLDYGVWSLIVATLMMATAQSWVLWRRSGATLHFAIHRESSRSLFPFGARVFATNLTDFLRANVDYLVVGRLLGPSALGIYTIAFKLADFPRSRLVTIVTDVAFPTMSSIQDDEELVHQTYFRSLTVGTLLTFPLLLGLTVLAPEFVSAVYGNQWMSAVGPLRVLLPMGMLLVVAQQGSSVLLAKGEPGRNLRLGIAYTTGVGALALLGVRSGLTGVALGVLAATVMYFFGLQHLVWRRAGITPRRTARALSLPLKGSLAMFMVLHAYKAIVPFDPADDALLWLAGAAAAGAFAYGLVVLVATASERRIQNRFEDIGAQSEGESLVADRIAT